MSSRRYSPADSDDVMFSSRHNPGDSVEAGDGTSLYGMHYDSRDNPWEEGDRPSQIEKDTDYLDQNRLQMPNSPIPRTALSLREAEIQFEKGVHSAKKTEELPEPLPPPYAWFQSDPSALLCPMPPNCMWPRVSRGGSHVKLMLRAAWEYELFSEGWDDDTKREFIQHLWNLHPQGTVLQHPLRHDYTIASIHLLRVIYGPANVSRHADSWKDSFEDFELGLPPVFKDCDRRPYGSDTLMMEQRNIFLKNTTYDRRRRRCERTILMLRDHPETLLSGKKDEMKPAGGNSQELTVLNWTPEPPCEWPSIPPDGVSKRDLQLALEVYNRWSPSWSSDDKIAFIKDLKYLKRTPEESSISNAYFYKHRMAFDTACAMYCLCITWGDDAVAKAPGLQTYLRGRGWARPSLFTAPPTEVNKLSWRTGIERGRLARGLPSWGTYLPILGLTLCPRVEGGVVQPGDEKDPLPTHPEIGWAASTSLMAAATDTAVGTTKPAESEDASLNRKTVQFDFGGASCVSTFDRDEKSQASSSAWGGPADGDTSAGSGSSRPRPSFWGTPSRTTSFTSLQPSSAGPPAYGETAWSIPPGSSTKHALSSREAGKRRATDDSTSTQRDLKMPRLREQEGTLNTPILALDTSSQIEAAIRESNGQLMARIEGIMSQPGNQSIAIQQIENS
jgi:hypothetical protein